MKIRIYATPAVKGSSLSPPAVSVEKLWLKMVMGWVVVARHNLKWVKIKLYNVAVQGLTSAKTKLAFLAIYRSIPSKHKTFVQHLYNVGPTSSTLVQHCINVAQMFCVCWDLF